MHDESDKGFIVGRKENSMKFWTSSKREWTLIGVLIGVVLMSAATALAVYTGVL